MLVSVLLGVAGAVLLTLVPLVIVPPPPGLSKARSLAVALVALAAAIVLVEWFVVH